MSLVYVTILSLFSYLSHSVPQHLPIKRVEHFSVIYKTLVQMASPALLAFVYCQFSNKNITCESLTLQKH
jgi:hypothetical protein